MRIGIDRLNECWCAAGRVLSSVSVGVSCMSGYVSGAGRDGALRAKANSSGRAVPQQLIGGAAFAFVALACGWTAYANLAPAKVEPVRFSDRFDAVLSSGTSIARRIETAHDAIAVKTRSLSQGVVQDRTDPEIRKNYLALMNGAQSLGAQPATFSTAELPKYERRLVAYAPQADESAAPVRVVQSVPMPARRPQIRDIALAQPAKSVSVAAAAPAEKPFSIFEKLFGKTESHGPVLAYAAPDGGVMNDGSPIGYGGGRYDRSTAVYDISAKVVYMPDGKKLEAHSGLGEKLDDPRFVHVKMRGATPPHTYDLAMRESLFHGVEAIRLKPVGGEGAIHGRTGLLAHTYMLGPNGDSNGCVSFKDYNAFLRAFKNGDVKKLVVVARID